MLGKLSNKGGSRVGVAFWDDLRDKRGRDELGVPLPLPLPLPSVRDLPPSVDGDVEPSSLMALVASVTAPVVVSAWCAGAAPLMPSSNFIFCILTVAFSSSFMSTLTGAQAMEIEAANAGIAMERRRAVYGCARVVAAM